MSILANLLTASADIINTEGAAGLFRHIKNYLKLRKADTEGGSGLRDILFITDGELSFPEEYRLSFLTESLGIQGVSWSVSRTGGIPEGAKNLFRMFFIFRLTPSPDLIKEASGLRAMNKAVLYEPQEDEVFPVEGSEEEFVSLISAAVFSSRRAAEASRIPEEKKLTIHTYATMQLKKRFSACRPSPKDGSLTVTCVKEPGGPVLRSSSDPCGEGETIACDDMESLVRGLQSAGSYLVGPPCPLQDLAICLACLMGIKVTEPVNGKTIGVTESFSEEDSFDTAENITGYMRPNIVFAVPKITVSGGIRIVLRHAMILQDAGADVSFMCLYPDDDTVVFGGHTFPVLKPEECLRGHVDTAVATMWTTVEAVTDMKNVRERLYLVQGYEPAFYDLEDPLRKKALRTYSMRGTIRYLTVSSWCRGWLRERFGQGAATVPNGIDISSFSPKERDWKGKIRILIEGDSDSPTKMVDESFRIASMLDPSRFEIWYVSYAGSPKPFYRCDRFMKKVPMEEMPEVYRSCHILLISSVLESFSLPPLEMMATGGAVVAVPNDGNREYLRDGENCLIYRSGDCGEALRLIDRIVSDEELRERIISGGISTAASRSWDCLKDSVLAAYGEARKA